MRTPGVGGPAGDSCPRCGASVDDSWLVCAWCGAPLSAPAELGPGTVLEDRFLVTGMLGRGGFGITYRARDQRLERQVAIKELFPPGAVRHGSRVLVEPTGRPAFTASRVRFRREATALAQFNHPGIVRVYEVFEAHNTVYLIMELLDGVSLHTVQARRAEPLSLDEVLDTTLRIGDALAGVHDAGLIHRDVNPSNVMLDRTGRIVLIDFGLARSFQEQTVSPLTRAVTPGYAPPEQYTGTGDVGPSVDVYALAATTYRLLTGVTPPNGMDLQAGAELVPPHVLRPDVPVLVSQGILDGLELDPGHRPTSAHAFLDRLGLHGRQPGLRAMLTLEAAGPTPRDPVPGVPTPAGPVPHPPDRGGAGVAVPAEAPPRPVAPRLATPAATVAGSQAAATAVPVQVLDLSRPDPRRVGPTVGSPPGLALPRVGASAPDRGWVTVPVGAALVALASSMPTLVGLLVAFVGIPAIATLGDLTEHRDRRMRGTAQRAWHRARPGAVAPLLVVRNLVAALIPAIAWAAVLFVGTFGVDATGDNPKLDVVRDGLVRATGVASLLCLMLPVRRARSLLRVDQGLDRWASWTTEHRGRPTMRTTVVWIAAAGGVILGFWLRPDLWPIPV